LILGKIEWEIGSMTRKWMATAVLLGALGMADSATSAPATRATTIVLVHGAFAGSSSWNAVIAELETDGYPVVAAANPLRSLKGDADYVSRIVGSIPGPVVLVGHSYGGEVISVAAHDAPNVKALVFVAGLAPDSGESAASLGARFPTGTLGQALAPPVPQADGAQDLYIQQDKYWTQFAADVPEGDAQEMAATQRPVTAGALNEAAGPPAWKALPSWFIYGSLDKNIPSALHAYMAKRAAAVETVEVPGASHVVMISHPHEVRHNNPTRVCNVEARNVDAGKLRGRPDRPSAGHVPGHPVARPNSNLQQRPGRGQGGQGVRHSDRPVVGRQGHVFRAVHARGGVALPRA
jgi:pimeloyl-ACP methyl ester carboxylesterase